MEPYRTGRRHGVATKVPSSHSRSNARKKSSGRPAPAISSRASEDLAADVIHAEVRFAPQLHTRRGLSMQEVLDAVARGLGDGGRAHGVTTVGAEARV